MFKIFFLVGQSGTGKDTIAGRLLQDLPYLQRYLYCTTRPKRDGETDGIEYYFKSWGSYLSEKVIIEERHYNFNGDTDVVYYSKPLDNFEGIYIVTGTIDMCKSYQKYYGLGVVHPIFIKVSDYDRLIRCIERERRNSENYKEIARRFYDEFNEYTSENLSSLENAYIVANDDLDVCINDIKNYIEEVLNA